MKEAKKGLMSPAEVGAELGLSRSNIYTLAARGVIRSIKFYRAVRFDPADVEAFIQKHRRDGESPKDAA